MQVSIGRLSSSSDSKGPRPYPGSISIMQAGLGFLLFYYSVWLLCFASGLNFVTKLCPHRLNHQIPCGVDSFTKFGKVFKAMQQPLWEEKISILDQECPNLFHYLVSSEPQTDESRFYFKTVQDHNCYIIISQISLHIACALSNLFVNIVHSQKVNLGEL